MNTPILTKEQQKHSLSAKKTPVKGLRNVLAQPHDNYWPVVSTDGCKIIADLLDGLLPALRRTPLSICSRTLRHMTKEERAKAIAEALSKRKMPDKNITDAVVIGTNAITRALERDTVCCILLDADADPPLIVKHIILMAQKKKIPILLLPFMKIIINKTIGYPSLSFALKNVVMNTTDHHFNPLYTNIYEIFKKIPPPTNSLQLFNDIVKVEPTIKLENIKVEDSVELDDSDQLENTIKLINIKMEDTVQLENIKMEDTVQLENIKMEDTVQLENIKMEDTVQLENINMEDSILPEIIEIKTSKPKNATVSTNVYRLRSSRKNRAFVPPDSSENPVAKKSDESDGFITLDNSDSDEISIVDIPKNKRYVNIHQSTNTRKRSSSVIEESETMDVQYLPLKVRRVQGNSKRVKATKASKQKKK